MPVQKSAKPASNATKPASATKTDKKVQPVSTSKAALKAAADELLAKKKPGRPPKAAATESSAPAAKRGRKPKADTAVKSAGVAEDMDMSDIEADLVGEPEAVTTTATGEKVKPLRMKISKAKERALMKEFGLDETVYILRELGTFESISSIFGTTELVSN